MQRGGCYSPLFKLVWNIVHLERKDIIMIALYVSTDYHASKTNDNNNEI